MTYLLNEHLSKIYVPRTMFVIMMMTVIAANICPQLMNEVSMGPAIVETYEP